MAAVSASIEFHVSSLAGSLCTVCACATATLQELKDSIEVETGIPPVKQCLIHELLELDRLDHLPPGATVHLQLLQRNSEQVQCLEDFAKHAHLSEGGLHLRSVAACLGSTSFRARHAACNVLGSLGEAATPHLHAVAKCLEDRCCTVRAAACAALGRHGEVAAPHLAAVAHCLDDDEWLVRAAACQALGGYGALAEPQHLAKVAQQLSDASWQVRAAACAALGEHGEAGRPYLAAVVDRLQDMSSVRFASCGALEKFGEATDEKGRECLAEMVAKRLVDASWGVRAGACHVLCGLGDAAKPYVWQVATCLTDDDTAVRAFACVGLGRLGEAAAEADTYLPLVPLVKVRLGDSDSYVRAAACRAIVALGGAAHLAAVASRLNDDASWVRLAACQTLGKRGKEASTHVPAIRGLLTDSRSEVSTAAADALLEIDKK